MALEDRFDKTVAASTAAGQVREFRLRVILRFRLDRPDGSNQLPEQRIELSRDMSYSETAALAMSGVHAVLTCEDIRARVVTDRLAVALPDRAYKQRRDRPVLAGDETVGTNI